MSARVTTFRCVQVARVGLLVSSVALACSSSDATDVEPTQQPESGDPTQTQAPLAPTKPAPEPASPASPDRAQHAEYPWQYCQRVGVTGQQRLQTMYSIATSYDAARRGDCRTAGLTPALDERQTDAWWDYLVNYSIALAGCPLVAGPLKGGILVFGPANTAAIGVPQAALARSDIARLIDLYVTPFAAAFRLE